MIALTYRLTRDDLVKAVRLWERRHTNIVRLLLGLMMGLGGTINFVRGFHALGLILVLIGLALTTNLLPFSVLAARAQWKANPQLHDEIQMTITREGVRTKTATSDSTLLWSHYIKHHESGSVFLLLLNKRMYNIVPKRAFSGPEQIAEFRGLLEGVFKNRLK